MQRKERCFSLKMKILGILVMFLISMVFLGVFVKADHKKEEIPLYKYYTSVQIHTGDTLWGIASEYCHDSMQLKDYMNELKEINHLRSDNIHAGRYLTVVYYSEEYKK